MTPAKNDDEVVDAPARIDQMIDELDDWRGAMLAEIRAMIHEADPKVEEGWKWMGSPCWANEGIYVVGNAHKDKVKLTFSNGADLPDPKGLFNNGFGGKRWRAIDLHEGDKLGKTAFKALVKAAVKRNREIVAEKTAIAEKKAADKAKARDEAKAAKAAERAAAKSAASA